MIQAMAAAAVYYATSKDPETAMFARKASKALEGLAVRVEKHRP